MRWSSPMPRATSSTSAPVSSQTFAISLMNEILVARNAFAASLIISALATSVRTSGAPSGAYSSTDGVARPVALVADDDAVGLEEVLERGALLEELRTRHVGELRLALLGEDPLDRGAGARRDRRLHHERVLVGGRHRVDDRVDGGEVGVAGVRRRRADGDEQQPAALERRREVGQEMQPLPVAGDRLLEPGLVDRHLAAVQARDLVRVDVDAPHLAAEFGKPGGGDKTDVSGADHGDRFTLGGHANGRG